MQEKKLAKNDIARRLFRGHYNYSHGLYNEKFFDNERFRADLKEINFDLSGANLSNTNLNGADFRNVNLKGAYLNNCKFTSGDVTNVIWAGVKLRNAQIGVLKGLTPELREKLRRATLAPEQRKKETDFARKQKLTEIGRRLKRETAYYMASQAKTPKKKVRAYRKAMGLPLAKRKTTKPR
ncbi:MAG: pentapeptide repeat-containing protein [archaeon]|nr:pentapeptide repeat-containing protein [archaeon]